MALKVTTASEVIEVKNICLTIYSQPGLGKTSLAFTAANPLLLDFDKGAYRAVDRKDVVQVESWADVAGMKAEDIAAYDTIIIDTVGKALDFLSADIIKSGSKYAYGGALNQQGWGQLGVKFRAFLKMLTSFGKDVILVSHMDEQKDGDAIKERLKIQGGSKDLVLTDSDVIARISVVNKERQLIFSPTETAFGKDPANIGTITIPNSSTDGYAECLAGIIESIKSGLNELSAAQVERKSEVEWFKAQLPEIFTADQINDILSRAKKAGNDVAKMVVDRAAELGFDFDPTVKGYVELGEPEQVEPESPDASAEDIARLISESDDGIAAGMVISDHAKAIKLYRENDEDAFKLITSAADEFDITITKDNPALVA